MTTSNGADGNTGSRATDRPGVRPLVVGFGGGGGAVALQCMKSPDYIPDKPHKIAYFPGEWFLFDTDRDMRPLYSRPGRLWSFPEELVERRWFPIPQLDPKKERPDLRRALAGLGGHSVEARERAKDLIDSDSPERQALYLALTSNVEAWSAMVGFSCFHRGSGAGMAEPLIRLLNEQLLEGNSALNLHVAIFGDRGDSGELVYPQAAFYSLHHLLNCEVINGILLADNAFIEGHARHATTWSYSEKERVNHFIQEGLIPLLINIRHPDFDISDIARRNVDLAELRRGFLQYRNLTYPPISAFGFASVPLSALGRNLLNPARLAGYGRKTLPDLANLALQNTSVELGKGDETDETVADGTRKIKARSFYAILSGPYAFYNDYLRRQWGPIRDQITNHLRRKLVAPEAELDERMGYPPAKVLGDTAALVFPESKDVRLSVFLSGVEPTLLRYIAEVAENLGFEYDRGGAPVADQIRNASEDVVQEVAAARQGPEE